MNKQQEIQLNQIGDYYLSYFRFTEELKVRRIDKEPDGVFISTIAECKFSYDNVANEYSTSQLKYLQEVSKLVQVVRRLADW